jgi:hypothetical protein
MREGRPFPDEGHPGFEALRNQLLGLLVYRAELGLEAKRLGVRVTDAQVSRRLELGNAGEEDEGADAFARETVRSQLRYEEIFRCVTRGVPGRSPRAAARRTFLMAAAQAQRPRRRPPAVTAGAWAWASSSEASS